MLKNYLITPTKSPGKKEDWPPSIVVFKGWSWVVSHIKFYKTISGKAGFSNFEI